MALPLLHMGSRFIFCSDALHNSLVLCEWFHGLRACHVSFPFLSCLALGVCSVFPPLYGKILSAWAPPQAHGLSRMKSISWTNRKSKVEFCCRRAVWWPLPCRKHGGNSGGCAAFLCLPLFFPSSLRAADRRNSSGVSYGKSCFRYDGGGSQLVSSPLPLPFGH